MNALELGKTHFFYKGDEYKLIVYYSSPTSWDHTCMAEIDLSSNSVSKIFRGDIKDHRDYIFRFRLSLDGANKDIHKLEISDNCDLDLIEDAKAAIKNYIEVNEGCGDENVKLSSLIEHINHTLKDDGLINDGICLSSDEILNELMNFVRSEFNDLNIANVYCGQSSDIDETISFCENNLMIKFGKKVYAYKCSTIGVVKEVLSGLQNYGLNKIDTTDCDRDSILVYIAQKS